VFLVLWPGIAVCSTRASLNRLQIAQVCVEHWRGRRPLAGWCEFVCARETEHDEQYCDQSCETVWRCCWTLRLDV